MERNLQNKTVVITGGAVGIGYAIADKFLEAGVKVVILIDINEVSGTKAVTTLNAKYGEGKAVFIKCDVTRDLEEVSKKIFDTYKYIDVLVNNAGVADELRPKKVLEINAISVLEWTLKFYDHMSKNKEGRGGTIVNIGSIYSYAVDPFLVAYKTAKYAVMGLTRCIGHEVNYKRSGVRVLIICPGFTTTALVENKICWTDHEREFEEFMNTQVWQQPEEVGKAAVQTFKTAESGSAWSIIGGVLAEVPIVDYHDKQSTSCDKKMVV